MSLNVDNTHFICLTNIVRSVWFIRLIQLKFQEPKLQIDLTDDESTSETVGFVGSSSSSRKDPMYFYPAPYPSTSISSGFHFLGLTKPKSESKPDVKVIIYFFLFLISISFFIIACSFLIFSLGTKNYFISFTCFTFEPLSKRNNRF